MSDIEYIKAKLESGEIVAVQGRLSGERQTTVFFQKKAVYELMASLTGPMQDAMVEIAMAKNLIDNPGFYRTMGYGRVSGMKAEDLSAWAMDINKRYAEWRGVLWKYSPMALTICCRVCQEEHSIDQIKTDERIGRDTANRLLRYGLNEYCVLAGWGDQENI